MKAPPRLVPTKNCYHFTHSAFGLSPVEAARMSERAADALARARKVLAQLDALPNTMAKRLEPARSQLRACVAARQPFGQAFETASSTLLHALMDLATEGKRDGDLERLAAEADRVLSDAMRVGDVLSARAAILACWDTHLAGNGAGSTRVPGMHALPMEDSFPFDPEA